VLASLPPQLPVEPALFPAGSFGAVVRERDELSLTVREDLWQRSPLQPLARAVEGPYRALSLDVDVDLEVTGFLAPLAVRLAAAGVSIVPQCGYLKDHLLVHEAQLQSAVSVAETLIQEARA
jgi:hypothetical protein